MEQLEEYPSTEQITAVISSQNDDSQPDQQPFDGSTDSEALVKNEPGPGPASVKEEEEDEKASDKIIRGNKSRVASSQNLESTTTATTTTNSVATTLLNYTLPELSDDGGDSRRAKSVTSDASADAISSGISVLKLSPTQVSLEIYLQPKCLDRITEANQNCFPFS